MKQLLLLNFSFLLSFTVYGQQFVGQWKILSIGGDEERIDGLTLNITKEGGFYIMNGERIDERSQWKLDDGEEIISVITDDGRSETVLVEYKDDNKLKMSPLGSSKDALLLERISKRAKKLTKVSSKKMRKFLVGDWEISSDLHPNKIANITLGKDGMASISDNDAKRKWNLTDDGLVLQFIDPKDETNVEHLFIKYINKNHFVMSNPHSPEPINLRRKGTVKKENTSSSTDDENDNPNSKPSKTLSEEEQQLVGRWEVTQIAIEEIPAGTMQIELKNNRMIHTYENDMDTPQKQGKWSLEDGNRVLVIADGYNAEQLTISYSSEDELILEDNGESIMLKKIK
ncbi:MAG: hypothetical protein MK212_07885 [Saprospiraceae bacterium]|nr:hypothetical protein [Saprospiraceae bacterium]